MKTMIENFINGNLTTAKAQAKRFKLSAIQKTLQEDYGFSLHKSVMTAYFLKNQCSFQEACDVA